MKSQAFSYTAPAGLILLALCLSLALFLPAIALADEEERKVEVLFPQRFHVECDDQEEDCAQDILRRFVGGGFLGVDTAPMTAELRTFFNAAEDSGVLISKVQDDSAAARAGLLVGDVITAVDGEPVKSPSTLARLIRRKKGGETAEIDYIRNGNASSTLAELTERTHRPLTFDMSGVFQGLEALPEKLEIRKDLMERAMAQAQRALEEQNLEGRLRHFKEVEAIRLEERMHELQERLKELESRIEKEVEVRLREVEKHHDDI